MGITRLVELKRLVGEIEVLTGLHIGAGNEEIRIGGTDNPVVRDPWTERPYIPGSSLKGKVRALLELATGCLDQESGGAFYSDDDAKAIPRIFGNGKIVSGYGGGPTRVSFSDCRLSNYEEMVSGGAMTEIKSEVSMNRLSGTAKRGGLRQTERVPRGARFDFHLSYKVFDVDGDGGQADQQNFKLLLVGLKLLENDALGGSGSRGYGRIRFDLSEGREEFDAVSIEDDLPGFLNEGN